MQAQTTLINFTVTKDGLEEQLLGDVVKAERPDLETTKAELTKQQNTFKITLKTLEDDLLHRYLFYFIYFDPIGASALPRSITKTVINFRLGFSPAR